MASNHYGFVDQTYALTAGTIDYGFIDRQWQCVAGDIAYGSIDQQWTLNAYSLQYGFIDQQWSMDAYSLQYGFIDQKWAIAAYAESYGFIDRQWALKAYTAQYGFIDHAYALSVYSVDYGFIDQQWALRTPEVSYGFIDQCHGLSAYEADYGFIDHQYAIQVYTVHHGFIDQQWALSATAAYYAYATNLATLATSRYDGFNFNSFAMFNGIPLAAGENGIVRLDGSDDDGIPVAAALTTGQMDFGTQKQDGGLLKRVQYFYAGMDGGPLKVTVRAYNAAAQPVHIGRYVLPATAGMGNQRTVLAAGVKARQWQFTVANHNGSDFAVTSLEPVPTFTTRRMG